MTRISAAPPDEPVAQEPADVVVDPAALRDRGDDGAEVVVGEDQVGGLPGHLGAAPPIATPMSARRSAGRVVDAVAGHRDHVAVGLPGADDVELLLRRGAGVHRRAERLGSAVELAAGDDGLAGVEDAEPVAMARRWRDGRR